MSPGAITYNALHKLGGTGAEASVVWYQNGPQIPYKNYQTVSFADTNYAPAWQNNAALSMLPVQFSNPARMDFHLAPSSLLRGAGTSVADQAWGFPFTAPVDLGAFGLSVVR